MLLVFKIINSILIAVGMIGVFGIFVFIPWGVVKLIKSSKETDDEMKGRQYQKGILLISLPFILIFSSFILTVLVQNLQVMLEIR